MPCYDGKPCPVCAREPVKPHAEIFNAMNRLEYNDDLNEMMGKLWDVLHYPETLPAPVIEHPAIERFQAAYGKLRQALNGVVIDGTAMRWVPGTATAVARVMRRDMKPAMIELDDLFEAHNEDERHSRGEMNVLREQKGGKHTLWGARAGDASYDHFVRKVEPGESGDIRHRTCGQRFVIADHHKDRLRRDPAWYGKFDCRSCGSYAVPFTEVEVLFA